MATEANAALQPMARRALHENRVALAAWSCYPYALTRSGPDVSHDCAQQTLHAPAGSPSGEVVASLSLTEAASWLALERSARQKAPISTSLRLTYALVSVLEARGLVRLDIEGRAPSVKRSIFDPVCWTVCTPGGAGEAELEALLLDRVRSLAMSTESAAERDALWRALAYAEAESYLAAQLRKHGFDPTWAERMLAALEHEWSGVPLAERVKRFETAVS